MFTKNFYAYQKVLFVGTGTAYTLSPLYTGTGICHMVDTAGAALTGYDPWMPEYGGFGYWLNKGRCASIPTTYQSSATTSVFGVYFGTGPTPATANDYTLEAPITSGLTIGNTYNLCTYAEDEAGNCSFTGTFRLTNTTSDEINIYEVGLVTSVKVTTSKYYPILMERTTFTEPFTILPGQTKVFTYKMRLNFFLNLANEH